MPQTQLLLAVLIPTLTVLVGILLNKTDNSKLDARLNTMEGRLSAMEGRLDARMNSLESRFHADMLMLIGKVTELDVRLTKLEGK